MNVTVMHYIQRRELLVLFERLIDSGMHCRLSAQGVVRKSVGDICECL